MRQVLTPAILLFLVGILIACGGCDRGESREERIERLAETLAAETLEESPRICWIRNPAAMVIDSDSRVFSEVPEEDARAVSKRMIEKLDEMCRQLGR